jgi:putative FmdB family regulatory protein
VPTYQYACTECSHQLEAVQAFTDDPLVECPSCAGRLRKVFSAVGIVFKGSGFYRTDSRSGSTDSSGKSAEKPKSGANGSSGAGESAAKTSGDGSGSGGSTSAGSSSAGSASSGSGSSSAGSSSSGSTNSGKVASGTSS